MEEEIEENKREWYYDDRNRRKVTTQQGLLVLNLRRKIKRGSDENGQLRRDLNAAQAKYGQLNKDLQKQLQKETNYKAVKEEITRYQFLLRICSSQKAMRFMMKYIKQVSSNLSD